MRSAPRLFIFDGTTWFPCKAELLPFFENDTEQIGGKEGIMEKIRYDQRYATLLEVYRLGGFSCAGNQLGLTPSAVAQQIHSIEKELDVTLFTRNGNKLLPTRDCETVVKYANKIQSLCRRMERELTSKKLHHLTVGVTPSAENFALSRVLTQYAEHNPSMQITVNTGSAEELCAMLKNYAIDLAVVEGDCPENGFRYIILDTDFLVVAVPADSQYAKEGVITLKELEREPLILKPKSSGTRCLFEAKLESMGLSPDHFRVRMEADSIATIKKLVANHYGLSVLSSKACMKDVAAGRICTVPLYGMNMIRNIQLIYRTDFDHDELLKGIQNCYTEVMRELESQQTEPNS